MKSIDRAAVIAMGIALVACGPADGDGASNGDALRERIAFDIALAELTRPCTLISIQDVQTLTGRPYFDTVALNRVDGARTRCAMAVGEGGMHGVAQLDMHQADESHSAQSMFQAQCKEGASRPPVLAQEACLTKDGAYAARIGSWVVVALVRRDPGQANQALSLRLLNVVTPRVEAIVRYETGGVG